MSEFFVQLTDAQLHSLDLSGLYAYSNQISTGIGLQESTVAGYQIVKDQYDYLTLLSQSTMDAIDNEISLTSNHITTAVANANMISQQYIAYESTIAFHEYSANVQNDLLSTIDISAEIVNAEYANIISSLSKEYSTFITDATYYSSLYNIYTVKSTIYENHVEKVRLMAADVSDSIVIANSSFQTLQEYSSIFQLKDDELNNLYVESNVLNSTLIQYRIDENVAITEYNSTVTGMTVISSLYNTAFINQQYYYALSTNTNLVNTYTATYSTFISVDAIAKANPSDTVAAAAALLISQNLSNVSAQLDTSNKQVSTMASLATVTGDTAYNARMSSCEAAVLVEIQNISTFSKYIEEDVAKIRYYSSLYEQADIDILSSIVGASTCSEIVRSSIAGSNAAVIRSLLDVSTMQSTQTYLDGISMNMSSLRIEYDTYISSYNGWIDYSSMMTGSVNDADASLRFYSTQYESSDSSIKAMNKMLAPIQSSLSGYSAVLLNASSIVDMEDLNILSYSNDIATYFNIEEKNTYLYREAVTRSKLLNIQNYYDASVLFQYQYISTQNAQNVPRNMKYVQITSGPTSQQPIELSQIAIFDSAGTNVAAGRETSSSGAKYGSESAAVDGTLSARPYDSSRNPKPFGFYSASDASQFFEVVLDEPTQVYSATVYTRSDSANNQNLAGFKIVFLDDNRNILTTQTLNSNVAQQVVLTQPYTMNTQPIVTANKSISVINNFLNTYQTIYSTYNTQNEKLQNISSSIGVQRYNYSTLLDTKKSLIVYSGGRFIKDELGMIYWEKLDVGVKNPVGPAILYNPNVKYVVITGGRRMVLSQIAVFDTAGNNIAVGRQTLSSGALSNTSESNVVDGKLVSRPSDDIHGVFMTDSFFQVVLDTPTRLDNIVICNPSDILQSTQNTAPYKNGVVGFKVLLLDASMSVLFVSDPLTRDLIQTINVNPDKSSGLLTGPSIQNGRSPLSNINVTSEYVNSLSLGPPFDYSMTTSLSQDTATAYVNATSNYVFSQNTTINSMMGVSTGQALITMTKINFLSSYNNIFTPDEIVSNESTISSFLIQGFSDAVAI